MSCTLGGTLGITLALVAEVSRRSSREEVFGDLDRKRLRVCVCWCICTGGLLVGAHRTAHRTTEMQQEG